MTESTQPAGPWQKQRARGSWSGVYASGSTSRPECAVCTETNGLIGLCSKCEAGPLCDLCADKHEATTGHPAVSTQLSPLDSAKIERAEYTNEGE